MVHTRKKSIIQFMQKGRLGFIVERKDPYYTNNFIIYKNDEVGFDREPSKQARKEFEKKVKK